MLSPEEELRYQRQIMLRQFDFDGQEALKKARVLCIGLGGLGCAATQYLAAAGIGSLTLVDDDKVELSNLHRQVLHSDATLGQPKVRSAAKALERINPYVALRTIDARLAAQALSDEITEHDLVLDCTDNLVSRNQLNALCFTHKKPLVSGAAIRMEGQISVFTYAENEPCYQCLSALFGEQTLSCVEAGVLSPLVGVIGAMQAIEAIKCITACAPSPQGKLMLFDAGASQWQSFKLTKQTHCSTCSAATK